MCIGIEKGAEYPIGRTKIHDWTEYEPNLSEHGLLSSLLAGTLRTWVENTALSNPLAIRWVYLVRNHQAHYICREISKWLDDPYALGILPWMLQELGRQRSSAEAMKKIASLRGEAAVYRLLRSNGFSVGWVRDAADWQVEGRLISVKTKLPLGHVYEVVAQAIRAVQGIEENHHCRKIRHVQLQNMERLRDEDLAHVLSIIDQDLEDILTQWLELHEQSGQVSGRYQFFEMGPTSVYVSITMPDALGKNIGKITLEIDSAKESIVSINYDMNAWWYEPLASKWLRSRISGYLDEVKRTNATLQSSAEAWINLVIHPRNAEWVRDNLSNLHDAVTQIAVPYSFPITVCLFPEYDFTLKAPILWSYGGSIGEDLNASLM